MFGLASLLLVMRAHSAVVIDLDAVMDIFGAFSKQFSMSFPGVMEQLDSVEAVAAHKKYQKFVKGILGDVQELYFSSFS